MSIRIISKKYNYIFIHLLVWVCYSGFNYFINWVQNLGSSVYILDHLGKYLIAAFIFYYNILFALPLLLKKRWYVLYGLSLIFLAFASFYLKQFLYTDVFTLFGFPESPYTKMQSFIMNSWWWFQYTLFGFGFWFAQESIIKEREKAQLEKDKLQAEYAYLKAQINPHFLYNVLNFFYAKAIQFSEPLADGILYLAEIMRYVISNEEDDNGQIPLSMELEQIENIININQLRFDNRINVEFIKEGAFEDVRIIPFVIVTLIENAFKHGQLINISEPLLIHLRYHQDIKRIDFLIKNVKAEKTNEPSTGIGLTNIKRRLSFAYSDRYSLLINDTATTYSVNLKINL